MDFEPDDVERRVPDTATARAMIDERAPRYAQLVDELLARLQQAGHPDEDPFLNRVKDALLIAYARFACRHGSWGSDRHSYHNEYHAWEIINDRLSALAEAAGQDALTSQEWALLALFAATHDLRQREKSDGDELIGPNERASAQEAMRILELAGFDRSRDIDQQAMADLELMINGSTFETDADADHVLLPSGGAVAPALVGQLRTQHPDWATDPILRRRARLALLASDLDTANVAEPFPVFARSAARLCAELEMRCDRPNLGPDSAEPVLKFLTRGQEYYFFQLHHFDSRIGRQVFTEAKERNAPKVLAMSQHMLAKFSNPSGEVTGQEIVDAFIERADELG